MGPSPDRTHYREVLAALASRTKGKRPMLDGRVEKALKLALLGDVALGPDGRATVYSSSDPTRRYELIEGTCTCRDWAQAPDHLCAHRLSAGFVRKAHELLPPAPAAATSAPAPLPEARCSVNVKFQIWGHEVQLTLRDHDERTLLSRLESVLAGVPRPEASEPAEGWCTVHGVQMRWNEGKDGRKGWFSHKTAEGWCKGQQGGRHA